MPQIRRKDYHLHGDGVNGVMRYLHHAAYPRSRDRSDDNDDEHFPAAYGAYHIKQGGIWCVILNAKTASVLRSWYLTGIPVVPYRYISQQYLFFLISLVPVSLFVIPAIREEFTLR